MEIILFGLILINIGNALIRRGESEFVWVPTMGEYNANDYPITTINCPHTNTNGAVYFNSKFNTAGQNVVINNGERVILRQSDINGKNDASSPIRITVNNGGELIFNDEDITIHLTEILVVGGSLKMGMNIQNPCICTSICVCEN